MFEEYNIVKCGTNNVVHGHGCYSIARALSSAIHFYSSFAHTIINVRGTDDGLHSLRVVINKYRVVVIIPGYHRLMLISILTVNY